MAQAGQQAGAAPDLVGLGRAGGDQPLDLGPVLAAEVGEGGGDVVRRRGAGRVPRTTPTVS